MPKSKQAIDIALLKQHLKWINGEIKDSNERLNHFGDKLDEITKQLSHISGKVKILDKLVFRFWIPILIQLGSVGAITLLVLRLAGLI